MTVPDSFEAWENNLGLEINRSIERHFSVKDQLAELKKRSEEEELTHAEEMQIFLLEEHSADADLDVIDLFKVDAKVQRAKGVK